MKLADDMIERAARVLCAAAGENPDSNELWDEEPPWMDYTDEARDALAAALGVEGEGDARILHRAPEPWQALADVMIEADLSAALSIPELAEALHHSGVRVTGSDDALPDE